MKQTIPFTLGRPLSPRSGTGYTLADLGRNGGSSTAEGDAPIGCNGTCTADIPNDAGLALINVGVNTVVNTAGGFVAASVADTALIVFDKVGFAAYGPGAPAASRPSLAGNFCEGACLQPVGDASTTQTCTDPTGLFPVTPVPPACYGQSGQYELVRRQTLFTSSTGTLHRDTNVNNDDLLMLSPNPGINVGLNLSGVAGVKPMLGAATPHDSTAPADSPTTLLSRTAFDAGPQNGPRNTERLYSLDSNVADTNNDPLGTIALRYKYTNNSATPITGLRFSIDDLSTLCGPQNAAPDTGTGEARNLSSTPNCQNGGTFTAILKVLNSTSEVIVDSTGTAQSVKGTVLEDLSTVGAPIPAPGQLSPLGGGIDNSLVINPSTASASVGTGVNGGTGVFATGVGSGTSIRVKVKFGVVKTGRFVILVVPMGQTVP